MSARFGGLQWNFIPSCRVILPGSLDTGGYWEWLEERFLFFVLGSGRWIRSGTVLLLLKGLFFTNRGPC